MSIGLGIIGAGTIAEHHARGFASAGVPPRGFCDLALPRAEALARQHDGAIAVERAEDLLAREDVDAVVIAVPNYLHRDLAIQALEAGKDVLLEKPMALNVQQCEEILEARRRTDRILQLGFICRESRTVQAARRLIEQGRLGDLYHVKVSIYRRRGIPGLGRWFTTRARSGGGVLVDIGVHLIDLAMHLTGQRDPCRVSGTTASTFGSPLGAYRHEEMWAGPPDLGGVFDVEDSATGLIRFPGGLTVELNVTWAVNLPEGLLHDGVVLLGDQGGVLFDVWGDTLTLATEEDGRLADVKTKLAVGDAWGQAWQRQSRRFADCVESRSPALASGEDGRAVQAVLDAMYESAAAEREVEVG